MNKLLKKVMAILIACVVIMACTLQALAANDNEIMPFYINAEECYADFMVEDGVANVSIRYYGSSTEFLKAEISVKIQKRFLLVFWNDVDIGYTNNEWTASSTALNGVFSKSFSVNNTGYYRALITVKIYGTSGEVDTIEFTKEYKYE